MSRPTVKLEVPKNPWCHRNFEFKTITLGVLSVEELNIFPVKFLLKQKPRGLTHEKDKDFFQFSTPNNLSKTCGFTPGFYAVNIGDFKKVLAGKPHVPNKKEAKILRQKKQKN